MQKCFLFFLLILPLKSNAFQESDSLEITLDEIIVQGFEGDRSILESPGSIAFINAETIRLFDNQSLVTSLNTIPGVRMEERAPGSYRISIRGSSLRSPFGVRNVKVYWNDIPFTDPSGSTPLNLLDVANMKSVEIIKGPAGSVYGAGNGGAVLMSSNPSVDGAGLSSSFATGSFGLQKYQFEAIKPFDSGNIHFSYANQQSDGYREQSFFNRETIELSGRWVVSQQQSIKTSVFYSDLFYGIPGGLNETQFNDDPTQARQGNPFALGSVEANASVMQEYLLMGITHNYRWSSRLSNEITLYGNLSDFENPFNLDYKTEERKSAGGRTRFVWEEKLGDIQTRISVGGELQVGDNAAQNYENDSSEIGVLNFDDRLSILQTTVFTNAQLDLPGNWYLTLGLSYNRLTYDIDRLTDNLNNNPGLVSKTFNPSLIPRIALLKKLDNRNSLFASAGFGFSPPTIEEIRTNEGSINSGLEAEKGANYEIGARGRLLSDRLGYESALFFFRLDESIVQVASPRGTTLFRNAGGTRQYGLEMNLGYDIIRGATGVVNSMVLNTAYTYHLFEYDNYERNGEDFSGNRLPGVAPHTLITTLQVRGSSGWYAHFSHNFTDEMPLDDANTANSEAYHLVKTKIGWQGELSGRFVLDVHLGTDNLLDEQYSLGYDINAFGNRYFQPAPERNWFGGVRISYRL